MTSETLTVTTPSGTIAYRERGTGPPAVFLHGAFLHGYQWRHQMESLGDVRRCLAPDLLAHGSTEIRADQDVSYPAQARMLAEFCDALELTDIDLVGNDSGGAIAQIFAAAHPDRVRTLCLTDCEVHDNWPPEGGQAIIDAAGAGQLGGAVEAMLADPALARSESGIGVGYAFPDRIEEETIRTYLAPLVSSSQRSRDLERFFLAFDNTQTTSIEAELRRLDVPTQIVWGRKDAMFDFAWAEWLGRTIPGAADPVPVDGGKMFHPEEFPDVLTGVLRTSWARP